jgi:4-aminobutyrate aminotransferase-like enzyme/Ser/Thr protein kinase RdoA (MazF antagonist)/murein DD-endopeptidase MepM/ murein hydrolase activator NlpD
MMRPPDRPDLTEHEVLRALDEQFGLAGALSPLPGERDRNYLLDLSDGRRYAVKVSSPGEPQEILAFESAMIERLHADTEGFVPGIRRTTGGALLAEWEDGRGSRHRMRVLDFLPGTLLAHARPKASGLLEDLGHRLAELDSALGAYPDHPPARVDFEWALGNAGDVMERGLPLLEGEKRGIVEGALASFRAHEAEFLGLGSQIIHGDVNDHNVLVSAAGGAARRVTGIIDFGDAHSAPRVFDIAIAVAYAILDTPDPLAAAAAVTRGYHARLPLLGAEVDVVLPLARARLGQSVCIAAGRRQASAVEDDYLFVSEKPAWAALHALAAVPERIATGLLREACGLEPFAESQALRRWLAGRHFHPVMELPGETDAVEVLDLSVGSAELTGRDTEDTADFTRRVFQGMSSRGVRLGIGRYLEPRAFYLTEAFEGRSGDPRERRTVHLGLDLFDEPGAAVYAPLAGRVKSVRDNAGRLDYGPTVMLEHDGPDGPFWTLYGHLQRTSVGNLVDGTTVEAGQMIARIGPYPENGDWPPHLHFQIMTDLLGHDGEFPGVALPREIGVWASLSPDPNLILRLPGETTFREPEGLTARRQAVLGPSLSLGYRDAIHVVRGMGAKLYDVWGRAYLDCVNNVAHVGHEHPRVVRAGQCQMGVLNTNTRYLHERVIEYAERLSALLPDPLSVCFFVNSGSEANELALRMARAHTGRRGVIALEGAYHGNSQSLVDVSHYKFAGPGGRGAPDWVEAAAMPDDFRGRWRRADPKRAVRYAEEVAAAATRLSARGEKPAAFLSESILSCGGQIVPPDGYLPLAYERARAAGALCIADEVQIGFGRVGSDMWGFEAEGALPDIVTLGKPMGNGHPIGAALTTPEIAASFDNGMEFFSTFGGNPVSASIGLAVLNVIGEEGLQARAAEVGGVLTAGLTELASRHPVIGDVRGRGLFLGVEFVRAGEGPEPAAEVTAHVVERMKERGVLLSADGPDRNVIKIKPPLCFSTEDAERLVRELDGVLTEDAVTALSGAAGGG